MILGDSQTYKPHYCHLCKCTRLHQKVAVWRPYNLRLKKLVWFWICVWCGRTKEVRRG